MQRDKVARRQSESGNMLFMIFTGVVLFAALSFALSSSGRITNKRTGVEEANLAATEVLDYANSISTLAEEMFLLKGVEAHNGGGNGILFAGRYMHADYGTPGDQPHTEIFHVEGGRAAWQKPNSAICSQGCNWEFTGQVTIEGVGTSRAELVMVLPGVNSAVCTQVNDLVDTGWSITPNGPPLVLERFDGTNYGSDTADPITLTGASDEFVNKRVFCYRESSGTLRNVFVQVLKPR